MPIDYSKLKGRITEVLGSQRAFAEALGLSERTVSLKMNGLIDWRQDEMIEAIRILRLSESDIPDYFFTMKVQSI